MIRHRLCKDNWQPYGEQKRRRRGEKQVTSYKATAVAQEMTEDAENQDISGGTEWEGTIPGPLKKSKQPG